MVVVRIFARENRPVLVALIVACAFFMEMLDGTVIATALPQMARSFHENPVNLSIGMSAYLIMLAVCIPSSGWLADRYGSKTIFAIAIVIFTVASVLCGISQSLFPFVAARVFQGVGGAMMVPVGRLVVMRSSDKRDLIRLSQYVTTPGLVAPVLGPPLGGFITTFSTWRWIFFLNIPIGIIGLALVLAFMENHRAAERRSFDVVGFVLSGAGLSSLVFGFDQLARPNVSHVLIALCLGGGTLVCALAYLHLRRARHPILDLSLWKIPTFASGTLFAGNSFRVVIGATPLLWPLLFQVGFGMSAFASGLLIIACACGDLTMKFYAPRILRRFGFRSALVWNGLIAAALMSLCALFTITTPLVVIALVLFLIGLSRSVQMGAFNALTYVDVPTERMSAATSLGSTMQQLAWGLGITFATLTLAITALVRHPGVTAADAGDLRLAFLPIAVLAVLSALDFLRLDPRAGAIATGHREPAVSRRALRTP
jgi:EmrB/QacA subfamily drug resistance transporter